MELAGEEFNINSPKQLGAFFWKIRFANVFYQENQNGLFYGNRCIGTFGTESRQLWEKILTIGKLLRFNQPMSRDYRTGF